MWQAHECFKWSKHNEQYEGYFPLYLSI